MINDNQKAWNAEASPHWLACANSSIAIVQAIQDSFNLGYLDDAGRARIKTAALPMLDASRKLLSMLPSPMPVFADWYARAAHHYEQAAVSVIDKQFATSVDQRAEIKAAGAHLAAAAERSPRPRGFSRRPVAVDADRRLQRRQQATKSEPQPHNVALLKRPGLPRSRPPDLPRGSGFRSPVEGRRGRMQVGAIT